VRLKNTTGKHLLQGPVTVLESGAYAGDARIDNLPPGQERLLTFGIDLDMRVDNTKNRESAAVVSATLSKGELVLSRKLVASREYAVDNTAEKDKTLIIEHPIRPGWKLVDTQKPAETTPTVYRFKGTATANKVTTLVVKEELVQEEAIAMVDADIEQLALYSRTGEIPKDVRDALAKAIQLKQAVIDVDRDINTRNQQVASIAAEQNRIRENMKTVAQTTQYYERLLGKLNEQESSIESLQKDRDALMTKRESLRRELDEYLNGLKVG
jgi:hypothetical protein